MKKIILGLVSLSLGLAFSAHAEDISFSEATSPRKEIELNNLRYKLEIQGDLLVFNKNGTRLLFKPDEERRWRFGNEKPITSYWNVIHQGLPTTSLYHEWQFNPHGELQLKIKQFDSMSPNRNGEVKTGKVLQAKEFTIENMNAPAIVLYQDDHRRVVAQFKIQIWSDESAEDIGKLGINSSRLTIFDNKGNVWASRLDNSTGNNVYFGVTTHRGSLYLSYLPFEGAKKIGVAEKNRIRIDQGDMKINIESADMLLPRGIQANVYGFVDSSKRSERLNQIKSYGSDKEASFLENIRR
ncbi:MAG: hypothetical protein JNL11_05850 [Bdellovibrionaceae bacterium]|nr:hypothetical protein [Pseudobdellovibrionaceae bacterium]